VVVASGVVTALLLPDRESLVERLAALGAAVGETPLGLEASGLVCRYLRGEPVDFTIPLATAGGTPFRQRVMEIVRAIPRGRVMTYGQVAALAGRPGAARAVGAIMAGNRIPLIIPCHRVVGKGGGMTGFSAPGGTELKGRLLSREGLLLDGRGRVVMGGER
jgi:methylated-DNA-[protein]-cysteine S-methyltransferase